MTPWTPDQCRAFVRRMYAIDHLLTVPKVAHQLGLHRGSVLRIAQALGTGRFIFGTFRFTRDEVERMRDRPDGRRQPARHW